jgi:hypothetical protein
MLWRRRRRRVSALPIACRLASTCGTETDSQAQPGEMREPPFWAVGRRSG